MPRSKRESIGPCTSECRNRSAECALTCEALRAHRAAREDHYKKLAEKSEISSAINDVQFHGLGKAVKRANRKK